MKIIDDISNEEIRTLEIPTGVPLIYELSDDLKPVMHYHVGYGLFFIKANKNMDWLSMQFMSTVNRICKDRS